MGIAHDVLRRHRILNLGEARVQAVLATKPLAYWRLAEGSSLTIRDSAPGSLYPGTYTGITWDAPPTTSPYNKPTPFFDGANDYGNVYSTAFASAFNMDEGAILLFLRVANAEVWTDAIVRRPLIFLRDGTNLIFIDKTATNNQMQFQRIGNNTTKTVTVSTFSETIFFSVLLSWTVSGDAMKAYKNGSQIGTTQTGNIAAAGSGLSSTRTLVGGDFVGSPARVWNGYLAEVVIWTKPADAQMIALGISPT